MENKTRMTNKNALQIAVDFISSAPEDFLNQFPDIDFEAVLDKLEGIRESYDKKQSKPTPNQVENEGFKKLILAYMENGEKHTAQEYWRAIPELFNHPTVNNQRVAGVLRSMVDTDGTVIREEINGKPYFYKA